LEYYPQCSSPKKDYLNCIGVKNVYNSYLSAQIKKSSGSLTAAAATTTAAAAGFAAIAAAAVAIIFRNSRPFAS